MLVPFRSLALGLASLMVSVSEIGSSFVFLLLVSDLVLVFVVAPGFVLALVLFFSYLVLFLV